MTTLIPRPRRIATALAVALVAVLAAAASPAHAELAVESFAITLSDTRAGAHADVTTSFTMETDPITLMPDERVRNTRIELPPGLVGNPRNMPTCSRDDWRAKTCPPATQVGDGVFLMAVPGVQLPLPVTVFNLVPSGDAPALFGVDASGLATQLIRITVRGDDYGLTAHIDEASGIGGLALVGADLTLWGRPADRGLGAPDLPFMSNPTTCDGPLPARLAVDSYESPGRERTASATHPALTDCATLPFAPTVSMQGDSPIDAPGRLQVGIAVPQDLDPAGQATAHLRTAVVTLPDGVSINPAMAAGLNACTDWQFARRQAAAPSCPGESAIGTAGIDVPLLGQRLTGRIYVGAPQPGDPYRVLVHAYGSGVHVKLVGSIAADPRTGRLTATFDGNPQTPFTALNLEFRGGPLAPLATPTTCGVKPAVATLVPYGGTGVQRHPAVTYTGAGANPDCASPAPFAPRFTAGTVGRDAGADAGFVVAFGREDGERELGALRMSMPAGLLGRLTAVPACAAADGAAGTCSADSLVGDVQVSVGAGPAPLTLGGGRVHLTAPYETGDVAGLSIVVPAKVGPYDLGTVVVRSRLTMRPDTGLEVVSDPLPTILQGIPLRIRQVVIDLGRPGFMFNPTDCSAKEIRGTVLSADGLEAGVTSPFQATGCAAKPFAPRTTVGTAVPSREGGPTGLRVELGTGAGESNVRQVELTLPDGLAARLAGPVTTPCAVEDWAAGRCADAARIGRAEAQTDVLPAPLTGSAYMVANPGGTLPRIGIRLTGAVTLDVMGNVSLGADGRIRTAFPAIPDVPLQRFELVLEGGDRAVLTGRGLCGRDLRADRVIRSHSGHELRDRVAVAVWGCAVHDAASKAKKKKKKKAGKAKRRGERRG